MEINATDPDYITIIQAAFYGLHKLDILDDMDISDEEAKRLINKLADIMDKKTIYID